MRLDETSIWLKWTLRSTSALSIFCIFLFSVSIICSPLQVQSRPLNEHQVKAAFLFNLVHFVTWPSQSGEKPDSPFRITILGRDPFGNLLDTIVKGEKLGGKRPIIVDRISKPDQLGDCHILFISTSERDHLGLILSTLKNRSVLTVSDMKSFIEDGGMVCLYRKSNRIEVHINTKQAEKANIKFSSKLLRLAKTTH